MEQPESNSPELNLTLCKETLALLKEHSVRAHSDLEALDSKARTQINTASLFLGFISTFQLIGAPSIGSQPSIYILLLIVAIVLYALMIFFSLGVSTPIDYKWPIAADWDDVTFYWDLASEVEFTEEITSSYVDAININQEAIDKKARAFKRSNVLFGLMIIVLVVAIGLRLFIP